MLDLIIIGASAAGASAGIYAARQNLNFEIIAIETGGEVAISGKIKNLPGWGETNGINVSKKFQEHLNLYNIKSKTDIKVKNINILEDKSFEIVAKKNEEKVIYHSKTIIIATGVRPKELNIYKEKEYRNKGLSYCTVCDGPLFNDKTVAIIGGGMSAMESALMMDKIASKVYLINKNPQFKGEKRTIERIKKLKKIEIIYNALTSEIIGNNFVQGLKYKNKNNQIKELKVDGIFIHIGMTTNSDFTPKELAKNEFNEIKINKACETNIPGIFAAGDITEIPHKQIVIASGQGACATLSAVKYLNK